MSKELIPDITTFLDGAYNQAIQDAISTVKDMATASPDNKSFFKKFGTYHYPYCSLISHLERLTKPSQYPNQ